MVGCAVSKRARLTLALAVGVVSTGVSAGKHRNAVAYVAGVPGISRFLSPRCGVRMLLVRGGDILVEGVTCRFFSLL